MVTDHTYTQLSLTKNKFFYIIQQIFRKFWKNCRKYTDGNNKIKLGLLTLTECCFKIRKFHHYCIIKMQVNSLYLRMEYKPEHKKWSLCSGISGNIRENGTAIKAENLYAKKGN